MSSSPASGDARPAWFLDAISEPGEAGTTVVGGATVHYRAWGPVGAPVVVLVHGGAAHAGWWDHVAPMMAGRHRVLAPDLTGHGSSDSRSGYDFETWADEVLAVAAAEGSGPPVVVGHSMGGVVALVAAHRHVGRLRGAVLIDLPDWVLRGRVPPAIDDLPPRRHHPTRAQAEERFRARPPDPARLPYVERHVARRSVRQVAAGWTWRFDHAVTTHRSLPDDLWGADHCPVVLVAAERGLMAPEELEVLVARLDDAPVVTIQDSGHHVMLDQPTLLTAAVCGILAGWKRRGVS